MQEVGLRWLDAVSPPEGRATNLWFEPMPGSHTFCLNSLERNFRIDVRILYQAGRA
jgi:hypothetical protein